MLLLVLMLLGILLVYRWYRQSQILENLSDKYVFITGCDTGFGNLLAKQLDTRGMKVLATCLTQEGAENLKKETSSRLQTFILDITQSQSVSSAAKWATDIVGDEGLWGLVNNAGIGYSLSPNAWQTKADFAKVLDVNLLGPFDVTVNLLPLIIKSRGRIVNVSSCAARLAITGGGYCPSKFGVEALSDSLRRELHDFGVKVSIIEPGAFLTPMCTIEPHIKNLERMWLNASSPIKDYFGEQYYKKYAQNMGHLVSKASPKLHDVTDCMEHALTAVRPWTRYAPGLDAKLYYIPLSYLPTVLSDYLLRRLSPKPAHCLM